MKTDPCSLCGSTEMNLIDGFYYCVECGTQDMNVRETIVEHSVLEQGTFAATTRKKVAFVTQPTTEMSGEWYKWHALNFILVGLADELISLGAKPSFKVKLLWIWTKYIKKYQNKAELGLFKNVETENNEELQSPSEEKKPKYTKRRYKRENPTEDIKDITKGLIISMLYVALNLDKSDIQLSHLIRFLEEGRLTYSHIRKFIPEGININLIPNITRLLGHMYNRIDTYRIRARAITLFRKLDLGTPVVPDLRKIIDNFIKELCLPTDLKPLVFSLMQFRSCEFLDIDIIQDGIIRIPDYEGTAMTYILFALKMCFGLDCEYEVTLSNAVERINDKENYPKSYKFGMTSEPTDRIFSLREWCNYLQFRKKIISHHCIYFAEKHSFEMDDDYVYMEQKKSTRIGKILLKDEIAMDIINKIHLDNDILVIPLEKFKPTLTPLSDYAQVISEHYTDPDMKLLLSEDFTQYSLKYVCEDLELIDSEHLQNVVVGINESNKNISDEMKGTLVSLSSDLNMVYVRNCDNKHWLKTNPPSSDHITTVEKTANNANNKENNGYDSNTEIIYNEKEILSGCDIESSLDNTVGHEELSDISNCDMNKVDLIEREIESNIHSVQENEDTLDERNFKDESKALFQSDLDMEFKIIRDEDEDKNIFDDYFENLDAKEEVDKQEEYDFEKFTDHNEEWTCENEHHEKAQEQNKENLQQSEIEDESDDSSVDSLNFDPDKFNRSKAIKELILAACQKYKIPIPVEYKAKACRKRKSDLPNVGNECKKKIKRTDPRIVRNEINELLGLYYDTMQNDVINQLSQQVKSVIQNMERNEQLNELKDFEDPSLINIEDNAIGDQSHANTDVTDADLNFNPDKTKTSEDKQCKQSNLFDEDSDGEINIDDFIPQGNPKFDEKWHDINQLYLTVEDEDQEITDAGDDLKEIVDRKIEEVKNNQDYGIQNNSIQNNEEDGSDSEDEVPLSVFQEKKLIQEQLDSSIEDQLDSLIQKDYIPELKYWTRRYLPCYMRKSLQCQEKFNLELKQNAPISFYFILNECASISNNNSFDLYKKLMHFEKCLANIQKRWTIK